MADMELSEKAQWRLSLGYKYFAEEPRNIPAAVREFRRVTELAPQWPEGYVFLAEALEACNQIDQAIVVRRQAMHLAPEDARHPLALGRIFLSRQEHQKAIKVLRKGLSLGPNDEKAQAHLLLAEALLAQGKMVEAREEWQRVLALEPTPHSEKSRNEAVRLLQEYSA